MTDLELAERLRRTVFNASNGEKTNAYVMFGIKYAGELEGRMRKVTNLAHRNHRELPSSMHENVGYGTRMARYAAITNPPAWLA